MASSYVGTEISESCETDSGSEVENGDLTRLRSRKPGFLKDELEEEDWVGFIALHSKAEVLHYSIYVLP